MGKWRKLLALVGIGCLILTGCGQNGDVTADSSSSQAEAKNHNYQTEEEVFQAMKTGDNDSVQALGNFYTSEFYLDYGTHVRLMDTEGNVHEPAYEMIENEEGESVSEIPAGQNFYYRPIFKFSAENQVFGDNLTSVVVNAGLQYEVDDNGAVVNDRAMLSYFRFPHELSDGSYTSGDGKDAADIAQLLGTDNFSEQFFDWIQDVRDHAETMKTFSNDADYFNTILQYRAEYMNYYTIDVYKRQAVIPIKDYRDGWYLFMATKNGIVKKTSITDYANVRKTGLAAITLREDDELIEVKFTDDTQDVFLVTKYGQCIRFHETDVRSTGRVSMGVIGMSLTDGDEVVGMQLNTQGEHLLIVSERGLGKRTSIDEFTAQNRGGKGVKCYKITEKTGNLVGVKAVNDDNEIMIINTEGIIIRMKVSDISILGRVTSGVKLINMEGDVKVASITKVKEDETLEGEEAAVDAEGTDAETATEAAADEQK